MMTLCVVSVWVVFPGRLGCNKGQLLIMILCPWTLATVPRTAKPPPGMSMLEEMAWRRQQREKAEKEAGGGEKPAEFDHNAPAEDRPTGVLKIAVAKALNIDAGSWDSQTSAVHDELVHVCHELLLGLDELVRAATLGKSNCEPLSCACCRTLPILSLRKIRLVERRTSLQRKN